jgi:Skp family chaperone for outer membrane proteins
MKIVLVLSALLVAGNAYAQTTPPPVQTPPPAGQKPPTPSLPMPSPSPTPVPFPADAKIAYIDLQAVVAQSLLGKAGQESMKALNEKLAADLSAKNKEIQSLQDRIKTQSSVVSDAVLTGMQRDLERLQRAAQKAADDAQVEVNNLNTDLLQGFQKQVIPIVEEMRNEKGLWIIFALGENSNIAAAHAGLDLSADLVKRLDAKFKK